MLHNPLTLSTLKASVFYSHPRDIGGVKSHTVWMSYVSGGANIRDIRRVLLWQTLTVDHGGILSD